MIVQENIGNNLVKTYSDQRLIIKGGDPEGYYEYAIDPVSTHRNYVETDIPIPEQEEEEPEND